MDLTKIYYDTEGIRRSILGMVKHEPHWAANRLQVGEQALEQNKNLIEAVKELIAKHQSERKHAWNNMGDPGSESYDKNATIGELKYLGGFIALELFDDDVECLNKIISEIEGD